MPRAEVGSTKYIGNKLKSKGLQRLRWFCQVCEKQCRDENGFKCHTMSESHVRAMQVVGENAQRVIQDYSGQFQRDFVQLLRTSHREKQVHINHFYQEYIANKTHVHMNATRWNSLTEFASHLGREGICRVEDGEKGIFIKWVDNSPEALRRQDALRKRERLEKGDEELQNKLIREQVERAQQQQQRDRAAGNGETSAVPEELHRVDGESRITLDFGSGKQQHHQSQEALKPQVPNVDGQEAAETDLAMQPTIADTEPKPATASSSPPLPSSSSSSKPKNVFAAKKSVFASKKNLPVKEPARKMSEAERIMRGELERKRARHGPSAMADGSKRVKVL